MMKQLLNVFRFEFVEMLKSKTVIITTVLISVALFGATFIPRLMSDDSEQVDSDAIIDVSDVNETAYAVVFEDSTYSISDMIENLGIKNIVEVGSTDTLKKEVEAGTYTYGIVLNSPTSYTLVTNDNSMMDMEQQYLEMGLNVMAKQTMMREAGIDVSKGMEIMNSQMNATYEVLGKDANQGFLFSYVMLFVLYMLILMFGNSVSTSVAREKDNRTMELLITQTSPASLILGKVGAMGLLGVLQISTIVVSIIVGFALNASYMPEFLMSIVDTSLSLDVILVYIIFSFLGYLLYLFIFAALGSTVSKMEDVSKSLTPVMMVFMVAFMCASIAVQMPDSTVSIVSSFIPFISFFTMPIRYMMTSVALWEIWVSLALLVVTSLVVGVLSIYIYRQGSLNYGNTKITALLFKKKSKKKK